MSSKTQANQAKPTMKATTIDEVIAQLESIVEDTRRSNDPLGIFAIVYLAVTRSVKEGVLDGSFQDGPGMERLDVVFANRYLDAYAAFRQGQPCTQSWQSTFDIAKSFDLLVLQHLLMGMNAHINLDLGIATAAAVHANQLPQTEADFNKINQLLAAKIDAVQDKLSRVSPLLFLLDWFGKRRDERFAEFSLATTRGIAWKAANRLAKLSAEDKALDIKELDEYVALINKIICKPGMFVGGLVRFIKWFEVKDVGMVLTLLGD